MAIAADTGDQVNMQVFSASSCTLYYYRHILSFTGSHIDMHVQKRQWTGSCNNIQTNKAWQKCRCLHSMFWEKGHNVCLVTLQQINTCTMRDQTSPQRLQQSHPAVCAQHGTQRRHQGTSQMWMPAHHPAISQLHEDSRQIDFRCRQQKFAWSGQY